MGKTLPPEQKPIGLSSDTFESIARQNDANLAIAFVTLVGIVALVVIISIAISSYNRVPMPCDDPQSFACIDSRVQECVASEKYTKDQCVTLVGGNEP